MSSGLPSLEDAVRVELRTQGFQHLRTLMSTRERGEVETHRLVSHSVDVHIRHPVDGGPPTFEIRSAVGTVTIPADIDPEAGLNALRALLRVKAVS